MAIIIPPEVTEQVIDDLCNAVDLKKHIVEGPHRTNGSYVIIDAKSFQTTVNKSQVAFDATHEVFSDWLNKYYNNGYIKGYLKGMTDSMSLTSSVREKTLEEARQYYQSHIDPKSVAIGVGITCGLFVAGKITKSIIEHKTNKENKKESKES